MDHLRSRVLGALAMALATAGCSSSSSGVVGGADSGTSRGATSDSGASATDSGIDGETRADSGASATDSGIDGETRGTDGATDSGPSDAEAPLPNNVVLFGGVGNVGGNVVGNTWIWDGAAWTQSSATGPSPRHDSAFAPLNRALVLLGGQDALENVLDDTWTWNGAAWTQLNVTGPMPPRADPVMAPLDGKLVLFGGRQSDLRDPLVCLLHWNLGFVA